MSSLGPFAQGQDVAAVYNDGERYVPLVDPYNAALHLGHMASYKHALRYAYGQRVLDIGCGTGYGAHYLASFGAARVDALDVDAVALEYAHQAYAHPRVRHHRSDAARLPFADASFEFVFSSQVIEHLASPLDFMAEIKRVLEPGGFCLVIAPNKDLFCPVGGSQNEYHINEMNLASLEDAGRAVFPHVEMAGVPQHCLAKQPDGGIVLKPNHMLRQEDYAMRRDDVAGCENLLLFGHTYAGGEFSSRLPASIMRAATDLSPCFWDAELGEWVVLGLYPAGETPDAAGKLPDAAGKLPDAAGSPRSQHVFYSPHGDLSRIDVALTRPGSKPVQFTLKEHSPNGRVLARGTAQARDKKLSLRFAPIANSAGREFCLELGPAWGHGKSTLHQLEHRGGQVALWTFHRCLPPRKC